MLPFDTFPWWPCLWLPTGIQAGLHAMCRGLMLPSKSQSVSRVVAGSPLRQRPVLGRGVGREGRAEPPLRHALGNLVAVQTNVDRLPCEDLKHDDAKSVDVCREVDRRGAAGAGATGRPGLGREGCSGAERCCRGGRGSTWRAWTAGLINGGVVIQLCTW